MDKKYNLLIFDLDGTLLDTSKGIFNSVMYTEAKMGLKKKSDEEKKLFLGPPPAQIYRKIYGLSEEDSMLAATFHRKYSSQKAIYEFEKYDGMDDTLKQLKVRGYVMMCATLKRKDIAEKVLKNACIDVFFDFINGMDFKESKSKADIIKECISMTHFDKNQCLMIGDSDSDILGAQCAGIDFWGVTYGFGFIESKHTSLAKVDCPTDLLKYLL